MKKAYENIVIMLNNHLNEMNWPSVKKSLKALFALLSNPIFAPAVMFQSGVKEKMIRATNIWREDDEELYSYITKEEKAEIFQMAEAAEKVIQVIPFVRHIKN